MIELVGVPFDLCGPVLGSRMGPLALRLKGLQAELTNLGNTVTDPHDDPVALTAATFDSRNQGDYDQIVSHALECYARTADRVQKVCQSGATPLVMGGDHSLSIGSISGALRVYGQGLSVLWIDAHMDFNTPASSPSKNFHGMPLAALARLDAGPKESGPHARAWDVWESILTDVVPDPGLATDKIAWIGLRDVDAGEVENYQGVHGSMAMTMQDVDHDGIAGCMERVEAWIDRQQIEHLWISFDVDSLDPLLAPGTGTKVRGGLTYREGHMLAELLNMVVNGRTNVRLAGLDVVEVNPLTDQGGETARVAIEWVSSLFGKRIMGRAQ